ncbi:MAG: ABC transporter related protein [uncultured bacterium]|nr:MAG: ABC transporter related protein [uncultured bacterium]
MEKVVTLTIEKLSKKYTSGSNKDIFAVQDISLAALQHEFISIVGPSGCGKSTLIKMIAGLLEPTSGRIIEHGSSDLGVRANRGVVFQQYSLFPWLNVKENIGFGLHIVGAAENKVKEIVSHYIKVMGLTGFEKSYPKELSGGMQQRTALARTLATNPNILLMDEPFSALDVQTRRFMQDLLLQILCREPRTVIFVTHDVDEAVFLSDTVYILSPRPGSIVEKVQVALPRPRDLSVEFSEDFIEIKKRIQKIITKESLNLIKLDLEIYKNL